ncbi:MAG: hypothetical protein WC479_11695 [Candidatus Izemoplasmatales bacterium]|jgi:hypothetical protein
MQVTKSIIRGEPIGRVNMHSTDPEGFAVENLWLGGLNWKQRKEVKVKRVEYDACCERNGGACEGTMLRDCMKRYKKDMRC